MKLKKGLTLIEILIAVAIVGILVIVIVVSLGNTTEASEDARDEKTLIELRVPIQFYIVSKGTADGLCEYEPVKKVVDELKDNKCDDGGSCKQVVCQASSNSQDWYIGFTSSGNPNLAIYVTDQQNIRSSNKAPLTCLDTTVVDCKREITEHDGDSIIAQGSGSGLSYLLTSANNSFGGGSDEGDDLTTPSAPTQGVVTEGNGEITLDWSPPTNNGGSAITGYQINVSGNGTAFTPLVTSQIENTYTETPPLDSQTRYYRIYAINAQGASTNPLSLNAIITPPATLPSAPTWVGLAIGGNGKITLAWDPPTNDGGSAITGYRIDESDDGVYFTPLVESQIETTYTQTGLSYSQEKGYNIYAINEVGTSTAPLYLQQITNPPPEPPASSGLTSITLNQKIADGTGDGTGVLTLTDTDYFGSSLALSNDGNTLFVGTTGNDTSQVANKGAVHILTKDENDDWQLIQKREGALLKAGDGFGSSVILSNDGNTVFVGADGDNTGGQARGAVHILTKNNRDRWAFNAKIADGTGDLTLVSDDYFGTSLALSSDGNILFVGTRGDNAGGTSRGAVHILTKDENDDWQWQEKIAHGTGDLTLVNDDYFGTSLALSSDGNTLFVGADGDNTGGRTRGAVHILTKDENDDWQWQEKIADGTGDLTLVNDDYFGTSLALSSDGNILFVGTSGDKAGGISRGAVHILTKDENDDWQWQEKIAHGTGDLTLESYNFFGSSLALSNDGNTLFVGADGDDTGGPARGTVYEFDLEY